MTKYQGMHCAAYPGIKGENVLPSQGHNIQPNVFIECT